MTSLLGPSWLKPFSSQRRKQQQRDRQKARRHFMEMLEIRTPLDGSCLVDVIGGDLVIACDASDTPVQLCDSLLYDPAVKA